VSAHHSEPTSPPAARPAARRRRRIAAVAVALGLLALPVLPAPLATAGPATGPFDEVELPARSDDDPQRLSPTLRDDLAGAEAQGRIVPHGPGTVAADPVEVVVHSADVGATRAAVDDAGGSVVEVVEPLVKALVPAAALDGLAGAPGTQLVREPYPMVPGAVSEGVASTGAGAWHGGGDGGAGVKVAVVDLGFSGYAARLGTELPASVETDFTRCSNTGITDHGTAVAEVVHDMAPAASVLLVCVEDDVDFVAALGTLAGKGVKVVNGSIGLPLGGRGDGSGGAGTAAAAVAALRRQGILYVASAGNYGEGHVHVGAAGDTDFEGGEDFVDISPDDVIEFVVAPGQDAFVSVKWDGWPTTTLDFDAYVADADGTCPIAFSDLPQVAGGLPPVELVEVHNCTTAFQVFGLVINRFSGAGAPRLDVFFDGAVVAVEDPTGSSLPEPATSPAVLTVGAHCVTDGTIEPYSSRGPTIDDRVKPDLLGPDGGSSSVYGPASGCGGGFLGTSAAAPHVAGAAALLLGANPALDVAELQQLLQDRAQDIAPVGPDNLSGAGRLKLGPAGSAPTPVPQPFTSMAPVRLVDTRPGTPGAAETVYGAGGLGQPVPANTDLVLDVTGVGGGPADATAVVLNVTATEPTASGWITVHPAANVPTASNLNFAPGQTVAVHVTATVGPDGNVRLYNSHGRTHLVVDVAGWYGPSGGGNAGLTPLATPGRAFDSRPGTPGHAEGPFGESGRTAPLGAGQSVNLKLAGTGGVPADATAVVVNLTVTGPTANGWFTMYPTGAGLPNASSLNFVPGLTVANLVVMPVGTNGQVTLRNSHGSSHAVVDVIGYFRAGAGARYVALDPPTRDLDTRLGNGRRLGPLGPGVTHSLEVARYFGVPARATAVLLSVTAVFPTAEGWLTIYPATASPPLSSNLNTVTGRVVPNAVISAVGTNGFVRFYNARGNTNVVSDLAGYFVAPPT
jgi:hypothetical protein